jgi:hypothetical protein
MIPIQWTANIANDPKAKQSFEETLRNSTIVLDRLVDILDGKEREINRIELSLSSYEKEGWPYTQAHLNGRKATLQEIKKLLLLEG